MRNQSRDRSENQAVDDSDLPVVVIDAQHVRVAPEVNDWDAATLLACISEDPADWSEIVAVWPRYQAGPSAEFADALPLSLGDFESAAPLLRPDQPWLVFDLHEKRVFSSAAYDEVRPSGCFGLGPDEGFGPAIRVPFHLPPWWLIHNAARCEDVLQPRSAPIARPAPRRDVLWGPALAEALAGGMLAVFGGRRWNRAGASADHRARYPFTVGVHRDWLMTPREDLGGAIPRQSLHGGIDWLDAVIEGQQWNVTRQREPVPIPRGMSSDAGAPMGRSEVCLYFDLCREMIEGGWQWLAEHQQEIAMAAPPAAAKRLTAALSRIQEEWMHAPYQGGSSPSVLIQNERQRIPEVATGGDDGHDVDCDCPLCQMMADGLFGPTFVSFDGHHLELDGEFAFSLSETHEQWECDQQEFADMSAAIDAQRQGEDEDGPEPAGEFDSVWQHSYVADEGLPGDSAGHVAVAFRLAEMIGELRRRSGTQGDVASLNQAFTDYRHADLSDRAERRAATARFQRALEQVAGRHRYLVSRAADLQSRLDELLRARTPTDPDEDLG